MKKTKKHHFTHVDPEKAPEVSKNQEVDKKTKSSNKDSLTSKDLRKVLMTIAVFTGILIALYFLNIKFELLQKFTDLVRF